MPATRYFAPAIVGTITGAVYSYFIIHSLPDTSKLFEIAATLGGYSLAGGCIGTLTQLLFGRNGRLSCVKVCCAVALALNSVNLGYLTPYALFGDEIVLSACSCIAVGWIIGTVSDNAFTEMERAGDVP